MRNPVMTATAAALGAAFALPAAADLGPCGEIDDDTLYSAVMGHYESQDFPGTVTAEGMGTQPAGASGDIESVVFWMDGDDLVASSATGGADFHIDFERAEGGDVLGQYFDGPSPGPMDSDEIEVLMECDMDDVPRLVGTAQVTVPEGEMDLTLDLLFLGDVGMHGVMQWETVQQGRHIAIRKPVTLTPEH